MNYLFYVFLTRQDPYGRANARKAVKDDQTIIFWGDLTGGVVSSLDVWAMGGFRAHSITKVNKNTTTATASLLPATILQVSLALDTNVVGLGGDGSFTLPPDTCDSPVSEMRLRVSWMAALAASCPRRRPALDTVLPLMTDVFILIRIRHF
jgi:hypothetical protein